MPPVKVFRNGKAYFNCNIALVLNHTPDYMRGVPEEFVIKGRMYEKAGVFNTPKVTMKEMGRVPIAEFWERENFCYYECGLWWELASGVDAFQLFYASKAYTDTPEEIPITGLLPLEFLMAGYVPPDEEQKGPTNPLPSYTVDSPFNAIGRWHLSHRFTKVVQGSNVVYLWRYSAPSIFESHSHVMSNHCATLPAIWEKDSILTFLEPGYTFQDYVGPLFKGEMVSISKAPTSEVAEVFHQHMMKSPFTSAFPFLRSTFRRFGCVLPMDMEFMHYLGYDGVPIIRNHLGRLWFCWNKKWNKESNNQVSASLTMGVPLMLPKPFPSEPTSIDHETWSFMSIFDSYIYVPWEKQLADHAPLLETTARKKSSTATILPLFHFDPRRYSGRGSGSVSPSYAFRQVIPSGQWDGSSKFIGFKLYTAMGWAPMDPLLKNPLLDFYAQCETDQIPLMNHCSPAGFYTHDRKFYFDLHKEKGRLAATSLPDADGWPTKFLNWSYTPQNTYWHVKGVKSEPKTQMEKIWWFSQQYVTPQSWKGVIKKHPKLKICFAHFAGGAEHLAEGNWEERKLREPENAPRKLDIGFLGDKIDPSKTHGFIYDLLQSIQPENRVFTDLSFVTLGLDNAYNFERLFNWAREHKPILLERILWGTDWPLIGDDEMVKDVDVGKLKDPVLLYRYAKGFSKWGSTFPKDFFLRCCFLNPIQFWGMANLKKKSAKDFPHAWLDEVPESILNNYSGDKALLFYKQNPKLFKKMAG